MQDERNSNIYLTPDDRKPHEEEVVLYSDDNVNENNQGERKVILEPKKELTKEDIELKKKKKNLVVFSIVALIDIALFIYIIYLVVSIFVNIAQINTIISRFIMRRLFNKSNKPTKDNFHLIIIDRSNRNFADSTHNDV